MIKDTIKLARYDDHYTWIQLVLKLIKTFSVYRHKMLEKELK